LERDVRRSISRRLAALEKGNHPNVTQKLARLKQEALLANRLLDGKGLLIVKRKPKGVEEPGYALIVPITLPR